MCRDTILLPLTVVPVEFQGQQRSLERIATSDLNVWISLKFCWRSSPGVSNLSGTTGCTMVSGLVYMMDPAMLKPVGRTSVVGCCVQCVPHVGPLCYRQCTLASFQGLCCKQYLSWTQCCKWCFWPRGQSRASGACCSPLDWTWVLALGLVRMRPHTAHWICCAGQSSRVPHASSLPMSASWAVSTDCGNASSPRALCSASPRTGLVCGLCSALAGPSAVDTACGMGSWHRARIACGT